MCINFFRNDLESLKVISCTDKKCAWSAPKQSALQQYDMKPLLSHSCLVQQINLTRERNLKGKKKQYLSQMISALLSKS